MADINKITTTYTDGTTVITASLLNELKNKINEVVDKVNGESPSPTPTPTTVSTPVITISGSTATITCATSGATIRYAIDSVPSQSSGTIISSGGTVALTQACTIKAIAYKDGVSSSVASQDYTPAAQNITFADSHVKAKLIAEGVDTNNDGEISPAEAAAVTDSLPGTWSGNTDIVSFDEFQYFTGVTRLKSSQFDGDSNLESIVFPSDITTFGGAAFKDCIKLGAITLPSSLTSIGDGAFSGCTLFNTTSIPSGVKEIGSTIFSNCSALSLSSLPNTITAIGNNSFVNCTHLALTALPSSLTTIGSSAFKASGITISAFPSGLTTISGSAFYGCTGITVSVIPATVTSIGNYAFRNCTGITTIEIASSGTALGENVFNGCTNLTKVKLPTTPPTLANANAFPSGANFYVPDATAKAAYLADSVWGTYGDSRFKLYSEW